jgi:G:T/U-mismatch repair DNA glycosylase
MDVREHPFKPIIIPNSTRMIIGTLPPEKSPFYYSNSVNNRLWDILLSIKENSLNLPKSTAKKSIELKLEVLNFLKLSMTDIIKKYTRKDFASSSDYNIVPLEYMPVNDIIFNTSVSSLLFVYKSAARWFLHYLKKATPRPISQIKENFPQKEGYFYEYNLNNRLIKCILLPNPLNRFTTREQLFIKKEIYQKYIILE